MNTLSTGRKEPHKNSVGGIKDFYFSNYPIDITLNSDDIVIGMTPLVFYKYEGNNLCSFSQSLIDETKTTGLKHFKQDINVVTKGVDSIYNEELKHNALSRIYIVAHTKLGESWVFGTENGVTLDSGSLVLGANKKDFVGYSLKFSAKEKFYANYISGSTLLNPWGILTGVTIITSGVTNVLDCILSCFIASSDCIASGISVAQGEGWFSNDSFSMVNGYLWVNCSNPYIYFLSGSTGDLICDPLYEDHINPLPIT